MDKKVERAIGLSIAFLVLLLLLYVYLDPVWVDGTVYVPCGLSYDCDGLLVNSPIWQTEDGRICLGEFQDATMIEDCDFSVPPQY